MMAPAEDYSDIEIEQLVRTRLGEQAQDVDSRRLLARIEASLASETELAPGVISTGRLSRWPRRSAWIAAAAVLLAAIGGLFQFWPETVHADSLIRESLAVHRLPIDRCYLIDRHRASGPAAESADNRVDRLWTRGKEFFWESSTDRYRWSWGRDDQDAVWLTHGKRHGIKLGRDELPPWLAGLCEVLSMEMETLLGDILQGYELTAGVSDSPPTVVIHAFGQPGRPHRWLKEATLQLDRETRVVRRATVTRLVRGGGTVTLTFTLVSNEVQPAGRYQLEGHLDEPSEMFTRDHHPQRRQQILKKLFGPHPRSGPARDNGRTTTSDQGAL